MFKNSIIYTLGELLPKIFGFFLLPIFTSYLSTEDYGIISYTNAFMLVIMVLSTLCLNTYLLRYYFLVEDEIDKKKMIGNVFGIILLFNFFLLFVFYLIGPFIINYTNLEIPFYPFFSLTILNVFFEVFSIIPLVIYRVKENPVTYVAVNFIKSLLIFIATFLLIVNYKYGVLGNFYGRIIVNFIFCFIFIYTTLKNSILEFNIEAIKKALKFSLPLIPGSIGFLLMSMSDRIILERYVSLSEIGIYSLSYTLAFSISIVIQGAYVAFEPIIFKEYGKVGFDVKINKIHSTLMLIVYSLSIGLTLFGKEILLLMTNGDFIKGYILVPIILIGVIASAQNLLFGTVLIAESKNKISSYVTIIGGLISVFFNFFLIPKFGIYAAALATAIAYFFMNMIILKVINTKIDFIKKDIISLMCFLLIFILLLFYFNENIFLISKFVMKIFLFVLIVVYLCRLYSFKIIKIANFCFKKMFKFK
jgi:O-antigen/teichoic acid export membrane protein